ncbi:MAG: hypothetical protein R2748_09670 [Bryobacterales bacterium]
MANGRLAFLIAYGPEARAFLQSGLAERMAQHCEVALVATRPKSAAFEQCPFPVWQAPSSEEESWVERTRARCRAVRRRSKLLGRAALLIERMAGRVAGGGAWTSFLEQQDIGALVAASADGRRTVPALQAAVNLGKPAMALLSSWRDRRVYAGDGRWLPRPRDAAGPSARCIRGDSALGVLLELRFCV